MMINRANVEAAYVGFSTVFNEALSRATPLYPLISMVLKSTHTSEQYNFMDDVPGMTEWVGDRVLSKLRAEKFAIVNKSWSNGIEVDREDIEDDNLQMVNVRIQQLATKAAFHYDDLVFKLLNLGFGQTYGLAYDGQFFFDTDHKDGDGPTQSNKATAALSASAYNIAWQTMIELKDINGDPANITPTHLIVGPKNRSVARDLLLGERLASGASNTNSGTAELIIAPRLTGTYDDYWFLMDLSKPIKPIVMQIRKPVTFAAQDNPGDEHAFMRKVYRYGADSRDNAGYGLWQLAYGSIL